MAECRYHGNCALMCPGSAATCDGFGHVLVAGTDMYDCDTYEPIPDVDALLRIAKVLESADKSECIGCVLEDLGCHLCVISVEHEIALRIREALGCAVKAEKKFICTGLEEVDVTLRTREDGLVMLHKETLVDIYQQGWYDGMSDTVAEPVFFNVYKMEAEDEHA